MSDATVRVTYLVQAEGREIEALSEALLLEQTVELPRATVRDPRVLDRIIGRVEEISTVSAGYRVTIAHPLATTAHDPAQLLNLLFGNSSLQPDVLLADVELSETAFDWLPGPRFGISGIRSLAGVRGRPLLATALKPMGLSPEQLGTLCGTFARAGLDLIKDDHSLADHEFCRFEARVESCLRAVDDASRETGRSALYVPNLIGSPERVLHQLDVARKAGVKAVLLSPMVVGLPLLYQIASQPDSLPILAHPALGGILRVSEATLFGKLFRWYGADGSIFPHAGGRFSYSLETCRSLATALRAPHPRVRPAFPVAAGGIRTHRLPELLDLYGNDVILLIGGSLYEAGDNLFQRARELVEQVARAGASEEPAA